MVAPAAALPELPSLYRLCVRAPDLGREQGLRGLYDVTHFAARLALPEQPLLGPLLSDRLLGVLDPTNDFHRQLALTATTFLDNGRRLDQTAAALFTHPNTVRYRLCRLRRITSTSLTDGDSGPLDGLHWWWALTSRLSTQGRAGAEHGPCSSKVPFDWSDIVREVLTRPCTPFDTLATSRHTAETAVPYDA
ncbi:helix-turn-helix domain-containing protein [Streptomyces sp. NBC_01235]|uniref:helix-turn-helix domain-containing protein n=1 Tax=Streptomyces sp. NBC_01235 TaxID=2903788 RepID=UPI002E0D5D8C|nr:helix-turn-helix domain-containing protein [Streptomyces sp. NBC_01235]